MELCNNIKFLVPLRLVLLTIDIIKIVVPIILVVVCMITFFKSVFNEKKELNESFKNVSGKLILAFSVYLVPTIITLLLSVIGDTTEKGNCINNATKEGIENLAIIQINELLEEKANVGNLFSIKSLLEYINDETTRENFNDRIEYYKNIISESDGSKDGNNQQANNACNKYRGSNEIIEEQCNECVNKYNSSEFSTYTAKASTNSSKKIFKVYQQSSSIWSDYSLSGQTVESNGCLLTSIATILSGYYNNVSVCHFLHNIADATPIWDFEDYDIWSAYISASEVSKCLKNGNQVIVRVEKGACTSGRQHYMPILDYKEENGKIKYYIADTIKMAPNNSCNGWQLADKINQEATGDLPWLCVGKEL